MTRSTISLISALALALATACKPSEDRRSPSPAPTTSGSASTTGNSSRKGGVEVLVAGRRPAVRDVTTAIRSKGAAIGQVRLAVSKIAPADGVRIALRFERDATGASDGGTAPSTYGWQNTAGSLRFTLKKPDGSSRVLSASAPKDAKLALGLVHSFVLHGDGLEHWGAKEPWKEADSSPFSATGRHTLRIAGKLDVAPSPVDFETDEIAFEIAAPSAALEPIAKLVSIAEQAAVAQPSVKQVEPRTEVVDDVEDNRWIRFRGLRLANHETVVDVLVTPAGKVQAMQTFSYFTCLALGTPISTPHGDRPVESVAVGDRVWAWDVARSRRIDAAVTAVQTSMRSDLVELGDLRLTPEHPVYADDRWLPAADVRPGALVLDASGRPRALEERRPVGSDGRPTPVFSLSVEWPHTHFAGGILVHNKAAPVSLAPNDPWRGFFLRQTD